MKFLFDSSTKSIGVTIVSIVVLLIAMAFFFIFDSKLSEQALAYSSLAKNEESRLGEFFQIVRLFGKADVLILLGICLGIAGKRRLCKQIIISLIIVGVLVHPAKNIVGRERPNHSSHTSFPSGDTATAFILPEIMSASTTTVVGTSILATGVAFSRIFYGMHYPSDVIAGAIVGLFAGCIGIWLSRRIRWLPTRNQLILSLVIFTGYLVISGAFNMHHRHNLQFLVWYGPALVLYMFYPYISQEYPQRDLRILSGKLYYYFKRTLYGFSGLGFALLFIPWISDSSGIRAPAFSAGLTVGIFAYYSRKELKAGRITSLFAFTALFFIISQISVWGYLLGKL